MPADRVLLVDDEVEFVETLAERMRARGLDARTALSGEEALAAVNEVAFDAIVLDLAMPGLDGIETLKRLREIDVDLQIMLLTGRGSLETAVEAMRLGAIDVLEKPMDVDALVEKIREARARRLMLAEERTQEEIDDILKRRGW